MPDLLPGTTVLGGDTPKTEESSDGNNQLDISNTSSWASGTPGVNLTFNAPTTGRVWVQVKIRANADTADNVLYGSFRLHEGDSSAGTQVQAESRNNALGMPLIAGVDTSNGEVWVLVEDLTPGDEYWAELRYQVSGGSDIDIIRRSIAVSPAT